MSKGLGHVERAIIETINAPWARREISTNDLCRRIYRVEDAAKITKAQRVAVLRAIRRVLERDPEVGWRIAKRSKTSAKVGLDVLTGATRLNTRKTVVLLRQDDPAKQKEKPRKVCEEIWCCEENFRTGKTIWTRAVITSRGGARPDRVTVEWGGRKWQAYETEEGFHTDAPIFSEERRRPKFFRSRPSRKQERAEYERRREWARANGFDRLFGDAEGGVSAEALAMLDLRSPFTRSEVLRAFRAKSLKAHPDQGGDADFFRALVMARDAALDDADPDDDEAEEEDAVEVWDEADEDDDDDEESLPIG